MGFAEKLKSIRIERGYTQKYMYTKLGISPNGYASYEQGRTEPNIDTIKKICMILDISSDYLFGLENDDGTKITEYEFEYQHNGTKLKHKEKK